MARLLLDKFERLDPTAFGTSTPIRNQAHDAVSITSDVEADDEIAQPLSYHPEENIPSTSGGGTSSFVAIKLEESEEDGGKWETGKQDKIKDQSLDINVEYTQKGDFVFLSC